MLNSIISNGSFLFSSLAFYSQQYFDRYAFLVPLGIIGMWRWSVWIMKEVLGLKYRPKTKEYKAKVSLVIPVYNENPQIFTLALDSWKNNNPAEIIAVIDYTDLACIEIFKKFKKTFSGARLIITKIPGKRPALAEGIRVAKSEIVALVDSDTIWDDEVLRNGLPPFADSGVGGVATYQSVLHPKTFAQKIFDIQLDLRYRHEYPFLAASGDALTCLSGRTAFYRHKVITPMLSDLVHEKFMGTPVISGDDKRLTYLVLAAGWKVAYQSTSHVYTPGMADLGAYLKQRLRWTRNSLRADLSAIFSGWPLKHPALLFFQVDKFMQGFVVILSPIYFLVSIYFHLFTSGNLLKIYMTTAPSVCIVGPGIVGQATGKVFCMKGVRVGFLGIMKDQIEKLRSEGYNAFTKDEILDGSYDFDITMFTVPTLTVNGRIDLSALEQASIDLGKRLRHQKKYHLVVVKSTVLPGTTEGMVIPIIEKYSGKKIGKDFGACMNPEYLRQETSYNDTLNPWMILVGECDKKSGDILELVYKERFNCPLFRCTIKEAEMQKYVHNIYNAVKITYFNEMRQIAKNIGANAEEIFKYSAISCEGMWNPSYGIKDKGPFDGACLPKDTQALLYWAQTHGFEAPLLETAIGVNNKLAANSGIRKFNPKSEELL